MMSANAKRLGHLVRVAFVVITTPFLEPGVNACAGALLYFCCLRLHRC